MLTGDPEILCETALNPYTPKRSMAPSSRQFAHVLVTAFFTLAGPALAGAQTWIPVGPPGGDVRALAADPRDPRHIYLGTADGVLYRSEDAGEHWKRLSPGFPKRGQSLDEIAVDARGVVLAPRSRQRCDATGRVVDRRLRILHRGAPVAEHPELCGKHQVRILPEHGPGASARTARRQHSTPLPARSTVSATVVEIRDLAVYDALLGDSDIAAPLANAAPEAAGALDPLRVEVPA